MDEGAQYSAFQTHSQVASTASRQHDQVHLSSTTLARPSFPTAMTQLAADLTIKQQIKQPIVPRNPNDDYVRCTGRQGYTLRTESYRNHHNTGDALIQKRNSRFFLFPFDLCPHHEEENMSTYRTKQRRLRFFIIKSTIYHPHIYSSCSNSRSPSSVTFIEQRKSHTRG